jgi:large subunit ribosomal protein L6
MSRIGKQPVSIPDKVKVEIKDHTVRVEGPKGKVAKSFAPVVNITVTDKKVIVSPTTDDSRFAKAMYGTVRSVIAGMVKGASEGYVQGARNPGRRLQGQPQGQAARPRARLFAPDPDGHS